MWRRPLLTNSRRWVASVRAANTTLAEYLSLAVEPADQPMDVTKHEQVADLGALEGEDWHARPPNMPTARRHTEQFLAMEAVEPHLAADTIAFLDQDQDVSGVLAERAGHAVDVADELVVTDERRSQRAAEGKAGLTPRCQPVSVGSAHETNRWPHSA